MNKLRGEREFHDLSRSSEYYTWHPYTAESTFYRKNGKRLCRICASASARARYQRKKAAS